MDVRVIRNKRNNSKKIVYNVNVVDELIRETLDGYYNPNKCMIYDSPNGYKYFEVDGKTITFFNLIGCYEYHIVICELSEEEVENMGMAFDEFISMRPVFTFTL